jgi:hypothetical protein
LQPKVYNYRQTSGSTSQPRLFHPPPNCNGGNKLEAQRKPSHLWERQGRRKGRRITACWPRRRRWWPARPPGCSAWRRCLPHLLLLLTPPSGWDAGRSIRAPPAARTDGTGTGTGRWESGRGPLDASTRHGDGRSRERAEDAGRCASGPNPSRVWNRQRLCTTQEHNAMRAGKMGLQKNTVRAEFSFIV